MIMILIIYVLMVPAITVLTVALLIGLIAAYRELKARNTQFNWLLIILLGTGLAVSFYYFCIVWAKVFAIIKMV
ncbi:hypothetical protein A9255_18685 [Xenorhabdus hominickii]|uniref:Uncharacterized protein n=1 Tax=Xenorhabdus hominickii TaxID=351679 RepID=A0A2G0QGQ7_XENHO|nr:hypothetical protein A9255_18685 [Xenorhabdus hominickii]PHM58415.1 hypothetical protein Xhom_01441 [Xenorhabdus hominickii]